MKSIIQGMVIVAIVAGFLCFMGCSQLKRLEKDMYNQIPEGEAIKFKVEACWYDTCISGKADTLSGAFDDLARQVP